MLPGAWFLEALCLQQGQHRRDVQQLLKSHEMARAVHQVVSPYAKAVPALALSVKDVRAILSSAADALHFVIACHTTVHFKASRAVIAQKTPSMQASCSACLCFFCLAYPGYIAKGLV